jgi:hypothetical protein
MIIDQLFTRPLFESQTDHITQFASNAHEEWRRNFDPTGTKPRIKKNSDGTEGDINVPFADLHPDWQKENLAAAHAAHRAVKHFGQDMEKSAEYVHNEWMNRNPKADYNAAQHVPYDDLPEDEKEKDRVHVRTMMRLMGHRPEQGVAEGLPGGFSKSDYMPGATKKHVNTNCTTCHGRKGMYKLDGKLFADNKVGAVRVKCPTCKGTGDKPGVTEGMESFGDEYLRKAADPNRFGRFLISVEQAQAELDARAQGKQQVQPSTPPTSTAKSQGFSKEYLQSVVNGTHPRPLITKEKAQELLNQMNENIDPLMNKLRRAMVKEGRVKELADDLKTLNNAEFMKKYGKAKAAIRKDMKKVDEGNANSGRRGPNSPPDNTPVKLGRVQKLKTGIKHHADSSRYGGTVPDTDDDHLLSPASRHRLHKAVTPDKQDMDEGQLNELSTNRLAQYKTAAAKDAKQADQAGDVNRGNKRFSGIVKATKKQFDNDAKKVGEGRQARRSLMAQMLNSH